MKIKSIYDVRCRMQAGVTLVELMIAMVIASVLMVGIVQIYLSSKTTYKLGEAFGRIQENSRFAVESIANNLRHAGFQGCADPFSVIPEAAHSSSVTLDPVGGSSNPDTVSVRHAGQIAVELNADTTANPNVTIITNPDRFRQGDWLMISDCSTAHVFQVQNPVDLTDLTIPVTLTAAANIPKAYVKEITRSGVTVPITFVRRWVDNTYCVSDTGRDFTFGDVTNDVLAVSRAAYGTAANCSNHIGVNDLVEGVNAMHILYGVRTDNCAVATDTPQVRYVAANTVANWRAVTSVRFGLELETADLLIDKAPTSTSWEFGTTTITPYSAEDNQHMKQFVTTTVKLRNIRCL